MPMEHCKECKKEVSTSSDTCPHCGIKNPTTKAKDVFVGVGALVLLFAIGAVVSQFSKRPERTAEQIAADDRAAEVGAEKCRKDLNCISTQALTDATNQCAIRIERLSAYSFRWTDKALESKFSRHAWANESAGTVQYIGDKIEFQNSFGAHQSHIYSCEFDPKTRSVVAVSAVPGRL